MHLANYPSRSSPTNFGDETEIVAPGEIGHDGNVAVGERSDLKSAAQSRETHGSIGPSVQMVPNEGKPLHGLWFEPLEPEAVEDRGEHSPMYGIELHIREATRPYLFHGRLVPRAPGIGEREPIQRIPQRPQHGFSLPRHAAAPIDERSEHIEKQGFEHGEKLGFRSHTR